jgi:hypothetical protein
LAGAPDAEAAELIAGALAALGLRRGFVVHGSDGLDEITTTGPTLAFEIRGGGWSAARWSRRISRVPTATPGQLKGGDAARNLEIAKAVLGGAAGAARDIVVANTSAALVAAPCLSEEPSVRARPQVRAAPRCDWENRRTVWPHPVYRQARPEGLAGRGKRQRGGRRYRCAA